MRWFMLIAGLLILSAGLQPYLLGLGVPAGVVDALSQVQRLGIPSGVFIIAGAILIVLAFRQR